MFVPVAPAAVVVPPQETPFTVMASPAPRGSHGNQLTRGHRESRHLIRGEASTKAAGGRPGAERQKERQYAHQPSQARSAGRAPTTNVSSACRHEGTGAVRSSIPPPCCVSIETPITRRSRPQAYGANLTPRLHRTCEGSPEPAPAILLEGAQVKKKTSYPLGGGPAPQR